MTSWRIRSGVLEAPPPLLMGVVNVTPDSFSDGGRFLHLDRAIEHGLALAAEGAAIVDVGGESTRPGAQPVDADEERGRVLPVIAALAEEGVTVSIDTSKPDVAAAAIEAGAAIVNDVAALAADGMVQVVADTKVGVVLMHMQGTPRTMQLDPTYDDVVADVTRFLLDRAEQVQEAGVAKASICLDPGIGFGKTLDHNLQLLAHLDHLVATGYPILLGTSRKSFLGALTGVDDAAERDVATAATTALAVKAGISVIRVHNIAVSRPVVQVADAIVRRGNT